MIMTSSVCRTYCRFFVCCMVCKGVPNKHFEFILKVSLLYSQGYHLTFFQSDPGQKTQNQETINVHFKIRSSDDDVTKLKSMVSLSDDKKSEFKNQIRVLQTRYRVSILTFCERHLWFFVKMTFCLGVKNQVSNNEFSMTTRFHDYP